jgi:polyisoprenyl-teichoic acid--peptidoglycan teichoic acid transferase
MSDEELGNSPKKFKRRVRWGRLFLLVIIMCALVAGCFFLGRMAFKIFFAPRVPVVAATEDIGTDEVLNKRINVLLLGIDDGDSEDFGKDAPKRTDAMMVVSFDTEHNEVSILSIPRDTRVSIPGHRAPDKINAAYAYGGIKLAKQTVANLLQIPIHYYILANWQGFIQIMDILGGVDLYVDHNMNYEDPYANLKIHLQQGFQHLDGEKAGEYVRFRHDELGDIGRVQRQQKFFKALAGEFFSVGNVVKLPSIAGALEKNVETDMDTLTMIRAANSFKLFGGERVQSEMIYGDFKTIDGLSYWVTSPKQVTKSLDELKIPHREIEKI